MEQRYSDQAKILKALADPKRLRIIDMLSGGELCACKILEAFQISQPTLSHDMKVLIDANLVNARPVGKWTHYSLNSKTLHTFYQQLGQTISSQKEVNSMQDCKKCGIYDEAKGACFHFTVVQQDCAYFTPIQFDDDERMSPENHWRYKIADMKAKSMQGPV